MRHLFVPILIVLLSATGALADLTVPNDPAEPDNGNPSSGGNNGGPGGSTNAGADSMVCATDGSGQTVCVSAAEAIQIILEGAEDPKALPANAPEAPTLP